MAHIGVLNYHPNYNYMKVALFTNTYLPHVGGVAKSVETLKNELEAAGHQTLVVAPEFDEADEVPDVIRVPAIQNFNGSDFSVKIPRPGLIRDAMEEFQPDLIHSHHPFLLGDSALREAWKMHIPLVFTHHTLYERYTHYVPFDSEAMKRMAIQMATEYCNLVDMVIAPSASIGKLLKDRGVETPIEVVPTGIDLNLFQNGSGGRAREHYGISKDTPVIGHVGRLAPEKNLVFLATAVEKALSTNNEAIFLLVGCGDGTEDMRTILQTHIDSGRVIELGKQTGHDLADAYAAMDCFVFASQTETQGIVLAEAMAARTPVVALDGPGVREIVDDGRNGRLLNHKASTDDFASAICQLLGDQTEHNAMREHAVSTASQYSSPNCVAQLIDHYSRLIEENAGFRSELSTSEWDLIVSGIEAEWELISAKIATAVASVTETEATEAILD